MSLDPLLTVAETAEVLNCDEEDVWYALENGYLSAVALAELEANGRQDYDYVWIPPEALRRMRGGQFSSIEWERHPPLLGRARVRADLEGIRILRHFVEAYVTARLLDRV